MRRKSQSITLCLALLTPALWPVSRLTAQDEAVERAVAELNIQGNRALSDVRIRRAIATEASSAVKSKWYLKWNLGLLFGERRFFEESEFRRDVVRILLLYRQSGFPRATVDTLLERSPEWVDITIRVREGVPVILSSLTIEGLGGILDTGALRRQLPLREGERFDRFLFQSSADTITNRLRDNGYPFAEVFRNFDVDAAGNSATASFEVLPGPRSRFGDVQIEGSDRVEQSVVRRMLAFRPGDLYRRRLLFESQRSLYRMDTYSYVDVSRLDSLPAESSDSTVAVRVQVSEGSFRRLRAGIGYGSVDCVRTLTGYTINNFLGGGRQLSFTLRLSKIGTGDPVSLGFEDTICNPGLPDDEDPERLKLNYNASTSLTFPYVLSRRNRATVTLAAERRSEISAFLREEVGGSISLTRRFKENLPLTVAYELSYGSTQAEPATFCTFLNVCRIEDTRVFSDDRIRSVIALSSSFDKVGSVVNPSRGYRLSGGLRWASSIIGSDSLARFTRVISELKSFHHLGGDFVFGWRASAGTILSPAIGLEAQSVDFVPPEERFYAGGPNSVRGFPLNELGPIVRVLTLENDTTTSPVGGNSLILANAELRMPFPLLPRTFGTAVFLDLGHLTAVEGDLLSASAVKVSPGMGFRLTTPIGAVRLDIGYDPSDLTRGPLFEESDDGSLGLIDDDFAPSGERSFGERLQFNFAIGHAF